MSRLQRSCLAVPAWILLLGLILSGCGHDTDYPNRPITLVCPWAAGGGTDRVSRQIAIFLEHELGTPVNVINATGGQGVTGHSRGIRAKPDGYTLAMMTLELSMLHWRGLTDLSWEDSAPLMSLNEDPAAVFVRNESEWQSIGDLEASIKAVPGDLRASGTASLGAWHLALAGWLISIGGEPGDVNWIPSRGARPSLQELMSGDIDLVCCSVPEARSLLDSGQIRCLGVMAEKRLTLPGLDKYPTLREQGSDWTLTGWRGLGVPKDTPPEIQQRLVKSLRKIVTGESQVNGQTFPAYMDGEGFDHTWRETSDFADFLAHNNQMFGDLLTRDEFYIKPGPVGPMAFPGVAFAAMFGCVVVIAAGRFAGRGAAEDPTVSNDAVDNGDVHEDRRPTAPIHSPAMLFLAVLLSVAFFGLAAESLGFVLTAAIVVAAMGILLGSRPHMAVLLALVAVPLVYQLFTGLLRVPLPIGVFGW